MDGVVPLASEPVHDTHVHTHVGEEAHALGSGGADLFPGEPGSVLERLLNVRRF
jgi:hypothetical protein